MAKRFFDFFFSLVGLLVLSPLFLIIGLLVRWDGGPAIFRQERIGLKGKSFRIYKFRSMAIHAEQKGAKVTAVTDPRITPIGQFIRKTKLDELPQLVNVLKGDMSLVGPRPEVPYFVERWPKEDREFILSVKPGITDYASLYYDDEQAVLAGAKDLEKTYLEEILPHKLRLYKDYVRDHTFCLDIRLILATLKKLVSLRKHSS